MIAKQYINWAFSIFVCLTLYAYFCLPFFNNFNEEGTFNFTSDYHFHLNKINGECDGIARDCAWYPSFFHTLFSGQGEPIYFFGSMFLLFVLFPLTFLYATDKLLSIFVYFSIGFAYQTAVIGTFPSALMFYLFLISLIVWAHGKELLSGLFLGMGALTHSKGPFILFLLGISYFVALYLYENKHFFPSVIIGLKSVNFFALPFDAILKLTPFPYTYALLTNGPAPLAWTIVFFVFSLSDIRGFWYLGLAAPIVVPKFLDTLNKKQQWAWIAVIMAFFIFMVIYWPINYQIVFNFARSN